MSQIASGAKTRMPAVEGMFTMDREPHLIGGRGASRESYFFPKDMAGGDPACVGDTEREEVLLSRHGKVWSYTTSSYPPPLPYVITTEPFVPLVIAAVHLEAENLVVCGQMMPGIAVEDMSVGLDVELQLDTLYEDDDHEYVVWKWDLSRRNVA
jgi:uncharacterized OB-fold protein